MTISTKLFCILTTGFRGDLNIFISFGSLIVLSMDIYQGRSVLLGVRMIAL